MLNRATTIIASCLFLFALVGCQKQPEQSFNTDNDIKILAEASNKNQPIVFSDPLIEAETRKILDKPIGDIMEDDVLTIENFGDDGEGGKFGDISGTITTLIDLRWFKDLKGLVLSGCNIESLDGIEELTNLQTLYVRRNKLSSIEPVRNLVNLTSFDCSENNIADYSALSALVNLEELCIGSNGAEYTDLYPLKNLTQLKQLYAPWCGIYDISVLRNMYNLEYLQLFHNNISDVSVLKNLQKLSYLELGMNKITDIGAVEQLPNLKHINLRDNPIPEDILKKFYEPNTSDYFVKTFQEKVKDDMPEYSFALSVYLNKESNGYSIETLTITNTFDGKTIQTISIPELTLFGRTNVSIYDKDTMGFELEDVNFDGYKDIRLFDTSNGNYGQEWIYLVWNPSTGIFENDERLNEISLASFDQENKFIYGMVRGSASSHYYSTYKYIDGTPTLVRYYSEEGLYRNNDQIKKYLKMASIETDVTDIIIFHETVSERNDKTGKMETVRDEYVFYPDTDILKQNDIILKIHVSSEIGQIIEKDS